MLYRETKIRFDGSHWLGLFSKRREARRGQKRTDKIYKILIRKDDETLRMACEKASKGAEIVVFPEFEEEHEDDLPVLRSHGYIGRLSDYINKKDDFKQYSVSRKDLYNSLYEQNRSVKKEIRCKYIRDVMTPLFEEDEDVSDFVEKNEKRVKRNLSVRRMRFARKCQMTEFNYFVTFTYDDAKLNEEQFKKKLLNCLRHLSNRAGWKYAGVWERGGKTDRLHFHALFYIPDGTFRGELTERETYSFKQHKRVIVLENTYFLKRFGMNEFEPIDIQNIGYCINYIMKYLEKSGEKITYSRGLPMYYVCQTVQEDAVLLYKDDYVYKVILPDDFKVFKDGEYLGEFKRELLQELPQKNN